MWRQKVQTFQLLQRHHLHRLVAHRSTVTTCSCATQLQSRRHLHVSSVQSSSARPSSSSHRHPFRTAMRVTGSVNGRLTHSRYALQTCKTRARCASRLSTERRELMRGASARVRGVQQTSERTKLGGVGPPHLAQKRGVVIPSSSAGGVRSAAPRRIQGHGSITANKTRTIDTKSYR